MAKKTPSIFNTLQKTTENASAVNGEFTRQLPLEALEANPLNRFSMAEDEEFRSTLTSLEKDGFLEDVVDTLCDEIKLHHVIRVQEGLCTLGQGFVFNDILTNYERVADHCSNIAVAMIELESSSLQAHEYLKNLKESASGQYVALHEEYARKYAI